MQPVFFFAYIMLHAKGSRILMDGMRNITGGVVFFSKFLLYFFEDLREMF